METLTILVTGDGLKVFVEGQPQEEDTSLIDAAFASLCQGDRTC